MQTVQNNIYTLKSYVLKMQIAFNSGSLNKVLNFLATSGCSNTKVEIGKTCVAGVTKKHYFITSVVRTHTVEADGVYFTIGFKVAKLPFLQKRGYFTV